MALQQLPPETRAEAFETVAQADRAVRSLLTAGFTMDQITVVAPGEVRGECAPAAYDSNETAPEALAKGGAAGAAIGGLALAATVLTGGLSLPAAALLVGGSALAGGFSNLIASKGYEVEAHDACKLAIQKGRIVVG